MTHLTPEQLATQKEALLQLKKETVLHIARAEEGARPVDLDAPIGRLSRMDAMQNQQLSKATRAGHEARLGQVMVALARFEDDTYGTCGTCRGPIAVPRLQAIPETPLCLGCQERFET